MKKVIFDIAGMRCDACDVGIEIVLGKKKGVKRAKVSFDERMAIVEYDSAMLTALDIAKAMNDIVYVATARSQIKR